MSGKRNQNHFGPGYRGRTRRSKIQREKKREGDRGREKGRQMERERKRGTEKDREKDTGRQMGVGGGAAEEGAFLYTPVSPSSLWLIPHT